VNCTGISQPPKAIIFAPHSSCVAYKGVRLRISVLAISNRYVSDRLRGCQIKNLPRSLPVEIIRAMSELVLVEAVIREKTFVGKVNFPIAVPEGLIDWLRFPDDLVKHGDEMGLNHRDVKFILGALRGKWGLQADLNPADLGPRISMTFAEIDATVRSLIEKNYAQFKDRLNLYRLWIVLLHVKGVRFDIR
jgi:hypothetical protein